MAGPEYNAFVFCDKRPAFIIFRTGLAGCRASQPAAQEEEAMRRLAFLSSGVVIAFGIMAGLAHADPLPLSEPQMARITAAGAVAIGNATAVAVSSGSAFTVTQVVLVAESFPHFNYAAGSSLSLAIAVSR
jgi:hypothetical protein